MLEKLSYAKIRLFKATSYLEDENSKHERERM